MGLTSFGSGSKGNAHLFKIGDTRILLDAGISPKKLTISRMEAVQIDAALITHEHQDHAKYVRDYMKMAIDCYMSPGTKRECGLGKLDFRVKTIRKGEKFKIRNLTITAFESFHDAAEPLNFLISGKGINLVYITDTHKAPYKIDNLTHIMIEANYDPKIIEKNLQNSDGAMFEVYKRTVRTHLSIDGAIEFLKSNDLSNVRKIYLIHLSDKNSDAEDFKNRVASLTGKETYIL